MPKVNNFEFTPMPGDLRRAMKASAGKTEQKSEIISTPDTFQLKICADKSGIYGVFKGIRLEPSAYGGNVLPGEVWICGFDGNLLSQSNHFVAMKKVSDAPINNTGSPNLNESAISDVSVDISKTKCSKKSATVKVDPALKKRISELEKENKILKNRNNNLSDQVKIKKASIVQLESRDKKIKELKEKLDSVKTEVKALKSKNFQARVDSLTGTIDSLQDTVDAKQFEIDMLRKKFRENGLDDAKAVPVMPNRVVTCMTGPTGIQCSLLSRPRYNAYFNPRMKTIRLVPDDFGDIECNNGMIHMDGLLKYSNYQKARLLRMEVDGDCVLISL